MPAWPRNWSRLAVVATAVAGVGVGALVTAYALGVFAQKPVELKPARIGPTPKKPPRPLPDDAPLEPWEEDAEAAGDVSDDHDQAAGPDEKPVGEGSPDEHCITFSEDLIVGAPRAGDAAEYECVSDPLGDPRFAPVFRGAPQAAVPTDSTWPLRTRHRRRLVTSYFTQEGPRGSSGRAFGAKRVTDEGVERSHVGIDLFANARDIVLAPEAGTILAVLPFHLGTWAVYLRTKRNQIINLGEVEPYSWREFRIRPGVEVAQGQPLARVGLMKGGDEGGSHMLHTEIYDASDVPDDEAVRRIRAGEYRWFAGEGVPQGMLDPSSYLVMAATHTYRRETLDA